MPPTPYKYTEIYGKLEFPRLLCFFFSILWVKYGIPEVREVSRNLPGARGFAVIEYGPVASHGDPIHARYYHLLTLQNVYPPRMSMFFSFRKMFLGKRHSHQNGVGQMRIECLDLQMGGYRGSISYQELISQEKHGPDRQLYMYVFIYIYIYIFI